MTRESREISNGMVFLPKTPSRPREGCGWFTILSTFTMGSLCISIGVLSLLQQHDISIGIFSSIGSLSHPQAIAFLSVGGLFAGAAAINCILKAKSKLPRLEGCQKQPKTPHQEIIHHTKKEEVNSKLHYKDITLSPKFLDASHVQETVIKEMALFRSLIEVPENTLYFISRENHTTPYFGYIFNQNGVVSIAIYRNYLDARGKISIPDRSSIYEALPSLDIPRIIDRAKQKCDDSSGCLIHRYPTYTWICVVKRDSYFSMATTSFEVFSNDDPLLEWKLKDRELEKEAIPIYSYSTP